MYDVLGYGIDESDLHSKNPDGSYKLLTLDIDFGIQCTLNCPHCFRMDSNLRMPGVELGLDDMIILLDQAIKLGLQYVKILGAGEPFEQSMLIPLIKHLTANDVHLAIFTKGHVIGNDQKVEKYFGQYGFYDSHQLMRFLKDHKVSILLGFNSFDPEMQGHFIGYKNPNAIDIYMKSRDRALALAIEYGFNEQRADGKTRLALIAAPIKPENLDEILDIYKFGRRQNIYVLSCPTTISGKGNSEFEREKAEYEYNQYMERLQQLYVNIYSWSISEGYFNVEDIEKHGISLYPGCHPCNQVAAGMYISIHGRVARCPGRDDENFMIENDVRSKPLKEIWMNSKNYKLAGQEDRFNFHCIARDGYTIKNPREFYGSIKKELMSKFAQIQDSIEVCST